MPIRKEFSFAKVNKPEKKTEVSTEVSREDIRITREENDCSENSSEEQKNEFELSNTSSAQKKGKRASARLSKKP